MCMGVLITIISSWYFHLFNYRNPIPEAEVGGEVESVSSLRSINNFNNSLCASTIPIEIVTKVNLSNYRSTIQIAKTQLNTDSPSLVTGEFPCNSNPRSVTSSVKKRKLAIIIRIWELRKINLTLLLILLVVSVNRNHIHSYLYLDQFKPISRFMMVDLFFNIERDSDIQGKVFDAETGTKNEELGYVEAIPRSDILHRQKSIKEVAKSTQYTSGVYFPDFQFNQTLSTEEVYQSSSIEFVGDYASIRSTLDYSYHSNYTPLRQLFQDTIITLLLNKAKIFDRTCLSPQSPWIVFTAGAMGAGKSYTIRELAKKKRFPLESFVLVDPDEVRRHLPEFQFYLKNIPLEAGDLTRKEAGLIAEIIILAAIQSNRNILVDGSLKDWQWYKDYFIFLKGEYGKRPCSEEYGERSTLGLRIGIFHITAPRHAVFQRAESRSQITGRIIPRATLEHTLATVPQSVKILAPLSDFFVELHNTPNAPDIKLVTEGMTWDSFRKVWDQTCSSSRHDDWPQNTYWSQKTNFIRSADWKRIEESTKRELNATKEMSFFADQLYLPSML